MAEKRSPDQNHALNAFWNDLVRASGAQDAVGESLSPETVDTVRRLHALGAAPPPASSRERVRRGLLDSYDHPVRDKELTMFTAIDVFVPGLNGRATPLQPRPIIERPRPINQRAVLAIAAILIVAIIGGTAGAIITNRLDSNDPRRGPAILAPGTPSPEADTTDETLVEVPLPADVLPPGEHGMATLGDITVPVGTFGYATPLASPGVMASYLLEGTVTVVSDGVIQVIRADENGMVEEIQPGTEIMLEPGDTLITRHSPGEAWTNEGPGEVRLITLELYPGGLFEPNSRPDGWNEQGGDGTAPESIVQPEAASVMRLRRVAVAADAVLVAPADALVFLVRPENGASIGRTSDGSVIIVGGQATTALIMTIELVEDAATPTPLAHRLLHTLYC